MNPGVLVQGLTGRTPGTALGLQPPHKSLAHQGGGTEGTGDGAVVPVVVLEGHVLASTQSYDATFAAAALGCKHFSKTNHSVGIIIPGSELLLCHAHLAPCADQAFLMPRLITVC